MFTLESYTSGQLAKVATVVAGVEAAIARQYPNMSKMSKSVTAEASSFFRQVDLYYAEILPIQAERGSEERLRLIKRLIVLNQKQVLYTYGYRRSLPEATGFGDLDYN